MATFHDLWFPYLLREPCHSRLPDGCAVVVLNVACYATLYVLMHAACLTSGGQGTQDRSIQNNYRQTFILIRRKQKAHKLKKSPRDTGRVSMGHPAGQTGVSRAVFQGCCFFFCFRKTDRKGHFLWDSGRLSQGHQAVQDFFFAESLCDFLLLCCVWGQLVPITHTEFCCQRRYPPAQNQYMQETILEELIFSRIWAPVLALVRIQENILRNCFLKYEFVPLPHPSVWI